MGGGGGHRNASQGDGAVQVRTAAERSPPRRAPGATSSAGNGGARSSRRSGSSNGPWNQTITLMGAAMTAARSRSLAAVFRTGSGGGEMRGATGTGLRGGRDGPVCKSQDRGSREPPAGCVPEGSRALRSCSRVCKAFVVHEGGQDRLGMNRRGCGGDASSQSKSRSQIRPDNTLTQI